MAVTVIRHQEMHEVIAQVITNISLGGRFEAIFQVYEVTPDGRTMFVTESIWSDEQRAIEQFDKYFAVTDTAK